MFPSWLQMDGGLDMLLGKKRGGDEVIVQTLERGDRREAQSQRLCGLSRAQVM